MKPLFYLLPEGEKEISKNEAEMGAPLLSSPRGGEENLEV
jgi:DNA mismatch repair protein MutH